MGNQLEESEENMKRNLFPGSLCWILLATAFILPSPAKAQSTYDANVGGETKDQSVQADAFFPNELWILEGDSIKWTFVPQNEIHTVTLLTPGQIRPPAPPPAGPILVGCAPAASYDGSACVSTATAMSGGATFTVTFPKAGNYKVVCLVHTDMTGAVHVLVNNEANEDLIHGQRFYDDLAREEAEAVLSDNDRGGEDHHDEDRRGSEHQRDGENSVTAGIGEIVATGGGLQYRTVVRFLPGVIRIHEGESVVWTNLDPTEPHTVTFGTEPAGFVPTLYSLPPALLLPPPGPPIPNPPPPCTSTVMTDCKDPGTGTVIGTINCTTTPPATAGTTPCNAAFTPQLDSVSPPPPPFAKESFVNSGFLQAAVPDRTGTAQVPPGTTRIRITFPNKGTYYYHCALHDIDGMLGTVIVE